MTGDVFIFTRYVPDAGDQPLWQTVTVYAEDLARARRLLEEELEQTRKISLDGVAGLPLDAGWRTQQIRLDSSKVLSSAVTR